ncbi:MAG TPA: radical SAM protein [Candidatus Magasanikbacteria bacterium]|nr:radical SAM protein [Candidatus Magasanikbacteria bacterium]
MVKVAWFGLHTGEEPPLVGVDNKIIEIADNEKKCGRVKLASLTTRHQPITSFGAGGIFFTGCNLRCVFCQNYQIFQENLGGLYSTEELANIMLDLQKQGAVNIDLVTPTIWWKEIKPAIILARERGLTLPIVWNSNGFDSVEILREMKGLVDIYLPDFKYSDDEIALKYSGIKNYVETAKLAVREMLDQVSYLQIENGIAKRGLIVRHMVLPNNLANSFGVLQMLSEIDISIHISLMNQYFPMHHASEYPEINRIVSEEEFNQVYEYLQELGFTNGWVQGEKSQKNLIPDFRKKEPFK